MRTIRFMAVLAMALITGCSAAQPRKPVTAEGREKWQEARAGVLYSLAKGQFEAGNFDAARKSLNEAAALAPKNAAVYVLAARVAIEQSQLELALNTLAAAAAIDPRNAEIDYLMGVVYQRWQKPDLALECYSRAAAKQPAELPYVLAQSEMLVALDRQEEALTLLRSKMQYFENSAVLRDAVGQLLLQKGEYALAADMLRIASVLAPEDQFIRERLAVALYLQGDYREAAEVLARLLRDPHYAQRADLLVAQGECLMHLNRVRDARDSFEAASQHDPSSVAVWLGLAKAAARLDDTPRVEMSLRKAMAIQADNPEVHLMLGYLRIQQGKLAEAVSLFHRASALDVRDTVSLCMIGYTLEKMGHKQLAGTYYARALKIRPDDELASRLMAQLDMKD